jgi:hypothetical protein
VDEAVVDLGEAPAEAVAVDLEAVDLAVVQVQEVQEQVRVQEDLEMVPAHLHKLYFLSPSPL